MMKTTEDFFAEMERLHAMKGLRGFIARLRAGRWRYYVTLPVEWPKDRYADLVAFWQRGRRGWADRDVWNLDAHLAAIIPQMLRHMADTTYSFHSNETGDIVMHSVDVDGNEDEGERWKAYLRDWAQAFDDYREASTSDHALRYSTYGPVIKRMHELLDHLPSLWD